MSGHISKEIHTSIVGAGESSATNLKTTREDNAVVKIDKVADILHQSDKDEYYLSDFE